MNRRGKTLGLAVAGVTTWVVLAACADRSDKRSASLAPKASAPSPTTAQVATGQFDPGVTLRVYMVGQPLESLRPLAENQTPNVDVLRPAIDFTADDFLPPREARVEQAGGATQPASRPATQSVGAATDADRQPFVAIVDGMLNVTRAGVHRFELQSAGGAELLIDGNSLLTVTTDAADTRTCEQSLTPGAHALEIRYFNNDDPAAADASAPRLKLRWSQPGQTDFTDLRSADLGTEAGVTRVTAPGVKKLSDGRRPGDGRPVGGVHPSFDLATIRAEDFEPRVGCMAVLPDGRLAVGTFMPLQRTDTSLPDIDSKERDKLYALSDVEGSDTGHAPMKVIADNLLEPLGLLSLGDALYVSQRLEITKLTDTDKDGFYETHETLAKGWDGWNYHQFTFGLVHRNGKLYAALSTPMAPPAWKGMRDNSAPGGPFRGSVIEVDLASKTSRFIAGGVRTPNTVALGPDDELFVADNQGTWMPTNQLVHIVPGHFYGHYNNPNVVDDLKQYVPDGGSPSLYSDRRRSQPAIYLPHNELSNSPTQGLMVPAGPYKGQMLLGELSAGGIRRIAFQKVNGTWQGAAFQFSQGFEVGINRMAWGRDGTLFVGGIGAGGNWAWNKTQSGLQRLTPNGKPTFEMFDLKAEPDDWFTITFTKPVAADWLRQAEHYAVQQWTYAPTQAYGGPKVGLETLRVARAEPAGDGRSVRLHVPGVKAEHCVYFRLDPRSADGDTIWSTEAWYTLAVKPVTDVPANITIAGTSQAVGSVGVGADVPADGVPLISKASLVGFNRGDKPAATTRPLSSDDLAALPIEADVPAAGGDLVSRTVFGDARLHVEWLTPPGGEGQAGGNSGVYLQGRYEMQVLNTPVPGGEVAHNQAAGIYSLKAPDVNASTGPGTWQSYDIWFRAPRFRDGKKIADARITALWNGRLVHNDVAVPAPTTAPPAGDEAPRPAGDIQVGPLVLQAHYSEADGPVRYRNVWIAPLNEESRPQLRPDRPDAPQLWGAWQSLINGDTFDGWTPIGGNATFAIKDGVITGTTAPNTENTFLTTTPDYGDFELEYEVLADLDLNSGVQFRSITKDGTRDRHARLTGYQAELDQDRNRGWSGGIYDEQNRGWLAPLTDKPAGRRAYRAGEWNRYRIVARGPVIATFINDVPVASVFDALRPSGMIGLQVHSVGDNAKPMQVRWRNIRIRTPRS